MRVVIPSEVPRAFAFSAHFAGAGRSEGSAVCRISNRNEQIPRGKARPRDDSPPFFQQSLWLRKGRVAFHSVHLRGTFQRLRVEIFSENADQRRAIDPRQRSEEHTSELQS